MNGRYDFLLESEGERVQVSEGKENVMSNRQFLSGNFMTETVSIMVIFSIKNAKDLENLIFLTKFLYPNVISKDIRSIKTFQFYNLPWK